MKITIGPANGSFGPEGLRHLYEDVASSPADEVYLGELACEKREHLHELLAAARELRAAGKTVYAASPILVTPSRASRGFRSLAEATDGIEVNSPALLAYAVAHGRWIAGLFLNIYNARAAEFVCGQGAFRIVAPIEFGAAGAQKLAQDTSAEIEVLAHGHVPVGFSLGCLSARAGGKRMAACKQVCLEAPEGLGFESDGEVLFRVDGPLTLSGKTWCLIRGLSALEKAGVRAVRIMPAPGTTGAVAAIFRRVLDGKTAADEAASELELISSGLFSEWGVGARRGGGPGPACGRRRASRNGR